MDRSTKLLSTHKTWIQLSQTHRERESEQPASKATNQETHRERESEQPASKATNQETHKDRNTKAPL